MHVLYLSMCTGYSICAGMVGYVENFTDPSYKGQILATTYPLLGNYGVQNSPPDELGLPSGMESDRIHVSAVLCQVSIHPFIYRYLSIHLSILCPPRQYPVSITRVSNSRAYAMQFMSVACACNSSVSHDHMHHLMYEVCIYMVHA